MGLNKSDIKEIQYTRTSNKAKIFNKKGLLIYEKVVSEEVFNKMVVEWFCYLEREKEK